MFLPVLFLIAQATVTPGDHSVEITPEPPHATHRHSTPRHVSESPSPTPAVRITIINATSVPAISLNTRGTNMPAEYPFFPQGEWTANAPLRTPEIHYSARDMGGKLVADRVIRLKPVSSQTLLLTGDLSCNGPSEKLPPLNPAGVANPQFWKPNFQFHLFPSELCCADPCHYRVFNGMPSKVLTLWSVAEGNKPRRQLAILAPGGSVLLVKQPACVEWEVEIDGANHPVNIAQQGAVGNCLIPFFLKNGRPAFVTVFEEP